jgi:DNA-binding beta-propeller fold protein YncE
LKKITSLALACMLFALAVFPVSASGNLPYDSYIYDYWENIVLTPAPYVPGGSVSGVSLGVGAFSRPQDMCVGPDGLVYVADTGNNRIVILNEEMTEPVGIIDSFYNNNSPDTFNAPFGVSVSPDNLLYVADSQNMRVIALDGDKVVHTVKDPQSEMLDEEFIFTPLKVAVDFAGRVYVIARGMTQGIMVFNPEGEFTGFFGTINVQITPWEIFWRAISTRAQRERQQLFIATEFTGIDVDSRGFIYASNIDSDGLRAVRRLNPTGEDVIRTGENEHLGGDLVWGGFTPYAGPSQIVDVVYRGKGIYSLLDSRRGRVFTYDREGNLLYIFGGLGSQAGTFRQPVSIEALGSRIAVLDAARNEIMIFEETLYGRLINEAVALRYDGDESQAVEKWRQVLLLNENLEIANIGIGKAYLTSGDNLNAMKYLRLGQSRTYYSIAYRRYRNEVLKANLPWVLTGVLVLAAALPVTVTLRKRRRAKLKGGADG